jgi:pimeloyl-ACP methyl ester carboxylesterase
MSKQSKPSIVFAHGLWADGSCFSKLIPALLAEGHEVMASQHSLDSLASDVAAVKACLARVSSPAILVGHSYGGTLITHAGTDPRVAGLVYIAALAPDADETSQSQQAKFPVTDVFSHIEVTDGRVWLKPSGVPCFAGDLPEAEQKLVYATQGVPVADLFTQKVEGTRVGALVGKVKAAGVPEHVWVRLEAKLGRDAQPRHHLAPAPPLPPSRRSARFGVLPIPDPVRSPTTTNPVAIPTRVCSGARFGGFVAKYMGDGVLVYFG